MSPTSAARAVTSERHGRTLVEMLVVLTVVGMMAATVAPSLGLAHEERGAALVARQAVGSAAA